MPRLRFATLPLLLLVVSAQAHESPPAPEGFNETRQHAPTPLPDRVMLTWSGDPMTTIDVTWRTDVSTGEPRVEYLEASEMVGNLRMGNVPGAAKKGATRTPFPSDLGEHHLHSAHLSGLKPATMYAYRVGDGRWWSEWHQFRTASDRPEPFTFVYFGDAQNAVRSTWSRVVREANQHAPRCAFLLHAGDLINRANRDAEWGEWFGAGGWLNGMIPSVATPGNHEYEGGKLSRHWRPQFSFPLNGPAGLEESVYWLDYQGARIVALNSNEQIDKQADWLDGVLSDPTRPKWTILTFHHPIFSAARERDNPMLRKAWRHVIERHGVDLVLQGHDHAYARSGLGGPDLDGPKKNVAEGIRGRSSNTVYVVSVSGPKMYPLQQQWDATRVASGVQLFQVIRVAPEAIRYEARLASGELYDAFTLDKDAGGRATLTDTLPDLAEIRE